MDKKQLHSKKVEWQKAILESVSEVLDAIEELMPESAAKHNILLTLKKRYDRIHEHRMMGKSSDEQLRVWDNMLHSHVLEFIDELSPEDFKPAPVVLGKGQKFPGKGFLLHKIPRQMAVGKEEECIVRLAFEQSFIDANLASTDEVEIKNIVVSEIMQADLIDPNTRPAFKIRTFSDAEQFLQGGDYTEWKFWVTPLRQGAFKLILKISVVEIIKGKERIRNISFEEKVEIVAAFCEVPEATFTLISIQLPYNGQILAASKKGAIETSYMTTTALVKRMVARNFMLKKTKQRIKKGGLLSRQPASDSTKAVPPIHPDSTITPIRGLNLILKKNKQKGHAAPQRGIFPQAPFPSTKRTSKRISKPKRRLKKFDGLSIAASLFILIGTIAFMGVLNITSSTDAETTRQRPPYEIVNTEADTPSTVRSETPPNQEECPN